MDGGKDRWLDGQTAPLTPRLCPSVSPSVSLSNMLILTNTLPISKASPCVLACLRACVFALGVVWWGKWSIWGMQWTPFFRGAF